MEALNAAALTPLSVLSDTKTTRKQPPLSACKGSSFSTFTNKKPTLLQSCLSKCLQGGFFLAASFVSGDVASALTYEEALGQPLSLPGTGDFDVNGFVESVTGFATENPAIVAGGVAILALPLVSSQVFKKPKAWGVESAKNAYAKLGAGGSTQLLDIRAPVEVGQVGSPDVGGLRNKAVSIAYKGDDKPGFLKKLALKFKEPENTTLFVLDKFDGNSELVAELVTVNGFKAAYAIKDGAEGPRGWKSSGLPWIAPKKTLSSDNLRDAIPEVIADSSDTVAVTLGIAAAAAGLSLLAFSEVEILEVVGSAALIQFAVSALPPWLVQLAYAADVDTEGPVELPFTSTPSIFATSDDPSPIQVASSILLTGAISVFLFRALRRRARRVKQSQFRSSGVKSVKEEALDSLKAFGSASIDAKGPPSPVQTFLGGIAAGVIALILYKFATTIEAGLNRQAISDNYSIRQITITIRTVVNGLTYLATFVFGLNSLGLFLYSGQLAMKSIMGGDSTEKETESKSTEQSNSSKLSVENTTDNTELSDKKEEQSSNDAQ